MVLTRVAAMAVAAIPLAIAIKVFHRFSPDRVAAARKRKRWAVGAGINRLLRPFDVIAPLLFFVAARLPRPAARVGAELALTFAANRLAGPLLLALGVAGALLDDGALAGLLLAALLCWGLLIADISVRDFTADTEHVSGALAGAMQTQWRQAATAMLLGCMLTAPVIIRWAPAQPAKALAVAGAIVALAGVAQLLGRTTRTARCFTVLFLFGLYSAAQVGDTDVPDVLGMAAASQSNQ